jgi:tRNA U55 pseudouridine synthase TruB
MAEGKMLILAGEACKEREKYLGLDKEYIFEILLGFKSDTKDILGIIENDKKFYQGFTINNFFEKFLF